MLWKLGTFNTTFIYLLTTNFNQKTVLQWVTTVSLNATTEVTLTIGYKDEKQPNHILHI